jgi:hypothetical protein
MIDCASGFLQIPVKVEDRPKTVLALLMNIMSTKECQWD